MDATEVTRIWFDSLQVTVGVEESCCGLLGSRFGPEIRGWIDKENIPGLLSWIQVHGR